MTDHIPSGGAKSNQRKGPNQVDETTAQAALSGSHNQAPGSALSITHISRPHDDAQLDVDETG